MRDLDHVLEHTEGLWNELRGERLFVTGGTGFFGSWMLESFVHANHRLRIGAQATVLTRNPDLYRQSTPHVADDPAITLWGGNVRDFPLPAGEFSHLLHLATETALAGDPTASFRTAVLGTSRVLELAERSGVRRMLITSSGAVYGPQPPEIERLDESYAGAPLAEDAAAGYGHGKRAAEFLCVAAARDHGIEAKIARCFAFVGPLLPLDANFAIGNFIRDALAGGPIRVSGDGTALRSYLYAADLAVWLWTILLRGQSGRPYNVGTEEATSIGELANLVARLIKPGTRVTIAHPRADGLPPARYVPSIERARRELGLEPWTALADGITRTADWYSAGPMRGGGSGRPSVS